MCLINVQNKGWLYERGLSRVRAEGMGGTVTQTVEKRGRVYNQYIHYGSVRYSHGDVDDSPALINDFTGNDSKRNANAPEA